jgi:hypothetical protein
MLDLGQRQCLHKCIGNHVIGRAIDEVQGALLDDLLDEVVAHINVLYIHMILVVPREGNCCLVVRKKGGGNGNGVKNLQKEAAQP